MPAAEFLSTLSLRRATRLGVQATAKVVNFYPRSPCGERRFIQRTCLMLVQFLSTLSLRRATFPSWFSLLYIIYISIHALLAESDRGSNCTDCAACGFLSTLSLRRATVFGCVCFRIWRISIHALLAESDRVVETLVPRQNQFLSTLSLRRATTGGTRTH